MPRDNDFPSDVTTPATKLRYLADFLETLEAGQVDMRTVHHPCGTAHCAWGWGEAIGLFPRLDGGEDDAGWAREMESAEAGRSETLGLTREQFRHCFGMGYQFRTLGRPYAPADIARHLRETAAELDRSHFLPAAASTDS